MTASSARRFWNPWTSLSRSGAGSGSLSWDSQPRRSIAAARRTIIPGFVGIIANPDSGKDIRRIVGHAVIVSTQQKQNILERLLVALCSSGVGRVEIMPDRFGLGHRAIDALSDDAAVQATTHIIGMPVENEATDSLRAATHLHEKDADCIVVLGGDGTTRIVSKACGQIPLLPISTGTNNVVPEFVEGTIAGLAAAYVASHQAPRETTCWRHKALKVWVNGKETDLALVDVAVVATSFVGARAVWDVGSLLQVFVTRASPTHVGISSLVGMAKIVQPTAPAGATAQIAADGAQVMSTLLPGALVPVGIEQMDRLEPNQPLPVVDHRPAVLALDGEREIALHHGDRATVELKLEGPWLVDVERTLLHAVEQGHYVDSQRG